jgi:hypothetical protein
LLEKADSVAKRLEDANKRTEELLARQESAVARMMLSGRANAGTVKKDPIQEQAEKDLEESKKSIARYY